MQKIEFESATVIRKNKGVLFKHTRLQMGWEERKSELYLLHFCVHVYKNRNL